MLKCAHGHQHTSEPQALECDRRYAARASKAAARAGAAPRTVLVVDDCADIRELLRVHLELLGYGTAEASDGAEAIRLVEAACPDLILMDINMPVMDGLTATRLIRRITKACGVAIVAFSALESGSTRALALDAGCNEFARKSMPMPDLADLVARHLPAG
ncbi:MAG: response regulator [Pyrinomonadaceae bacterium]